MSKAIVGAVSVETAHVQADYPYSFRLRCQRRCWVETKPGHGQRFVTQTSNPKRLGVWNKPKAGTYHEIVVLTVDEQDRVEIDGLSAYDGEDKITAFEARHAGALTDWQVKRMGALRVLKRAAARITFTVHVGGEPQTREERRAIMQAAVGAELRAMREAEGK